MNNYSNECFTEVGPKVDDIISFEDDEEEILKAIRIRIKLINVRRLIYERTYNSAK